MSDSDVLGLERLEDRVVLLTLNRPEHRNALSLQLRTDLANCLKALAADEFVAAVVLRGAGDVFCAGFDLKELSEGDAAAIFSEARAYHHAVHTFSKPLIAAVNGPAMAGGMDLAFMCDIRLGCPDSAFGQPQVRMGIPAAYDLLASVTDAATARYLSLTGDKLDASTALARGILANLYPNNETLLHEAAACASTIAKGNGGARMKAQFVATQPELYGRE